MEQIGLLLFGERLNAVYFLPLLLTNNNRNHLETVAQGELLPNLRELLSMLVTFSLTVFAWIFFRAENIGHACQYIAGIFKNPYSYTLLSTYWVYKKIIFIILLFLLTEWLGRKGKHALSSLSFLNSRALTWSIYLLIIVFIIVFKGRQQEFIYFQF